MEWLTPLLNILPENWHLWFVLLVILAAVIVFALDKFALESVSIVVLLVLMTVFYLAPYQTAEGEKVSAADFLEGLANPALIAVLSLLVLGQAVVNTGALNMVTQLLFRACGSFYWLATVISLMVLMCLSAFMNNTPAVIIFIPILLALAKELNISPSKVMIPVSYVSILGGTTVLIGSSTNLIVSGSLQSLGMEPLSMFDFTLPGVLLAIIGFIYTITVLPRLLPNRAPLASELMGEDKEFVVQLEIPVKSSLVGKSVNDATLLDIEGFSVRMLQRREHAYLSPFDEELVIKPFDILVITVTKESLIHLISQKDKSLFGRISALNADLPDMNKDTAENLTVVEVLVTPASRMIGQSIEQLGFYHHHHCMVIGLQRRSRMITARMTESRLAAGDVLMVMGKRDDIERLRNSKDMMLMEWSRRELPSKKLAWRANLLFAAVVGLAAANILPIYIGGMIGAALSVFLGCLTPRQALRAIDTQIIMLVVAGMAMGIALQVTGGAALLAETLIDVMDGVAPVWIMSALFVLMAIMTNVLSNSAAALIFTPIAVSTAATLGVPHEMFVFAVIFACNTCSFASPIGYQTNLLVMGPGHYTFGDYLKAGIPLMVLMWVTYTAYAWLRYTDGLERMMP